MSRRVEFADRADVEALLSPAQLEVLQDVIRGAGLNPDGWEYTGAARLFELLAVLALRDQYSARGKRPKPALAEACAALGVNVETMRARLADWRRESFTRRGVAQPPDRAPAPLQIGGARRERR